MREFLFFTIANNFPRLSLIDKIRWIFYRMSGMRINGRCTIYGPLTVRPIGACKNISIGRKTFLNTEIRFGARANIAIGERCRIGPRVCFETVGHGTMIDVSGRRGSSAKPISVGNDVWIGCGAIILGGVTIGEGVVVAAGAVVVRDVPAYTVVGGIPAKPLKHTP